ANSETTAARARALGFRGPMLVAKPGGDRFPALPSESQIEARAYERGPLQLTFIGNLIPRKGVHTLLQALAHVPRDRWRLRLVGSKTVDPAYARRVGAMLGSLKLAFYAQFLGPLTDRDLAATLERTHLVVAPSTYEGFGIVSLEGMAFGAPPIATTAGAGPEIIRHGVDGVLVPPNDPSAIAEWTRQLADDRDRLAAMSVAARRRFAEHPTWRQTCAAIRAFVEERVRAWNRSPASVL
ncbi:MAG: glycosyltransferase family 4 protein, partial [Dehalococcoidia bacterium]|nr:glycosyltransferase family 4 protein [Dehalococcoidia bacterium]